MILLVRPAGVTIAAPSGWRVNHELVLDEYSPVSVFESVEEAVFLPLARSLRIRPSG
jgi:hypothetical protein